MEMYETHLGTDRVQMDGSTNTLTRWDSAGQEVEKRPLTPVEQNFLATALAPERLVGLTDAVNQLVLDALMGGM